MHKIINFRKTAASATIFAALEFFGYTGEIQALAAENARFWSGNELYQACLEGRAQSYVLGAYDAFSVAQGDAAKAVQCIPSGVQSGQLKDVVCKELANNPKTRHYNASIIVAAALSEAFPCNR